MTNKILHEIITISHAVDVLNDAYKADPDAMDVLIRARVPCNKELAGHPTIQVAANKELTEFKVGFLGVLNGLFGVAPDGMGAVASIHKVKCPQNHRVEESARVRDTCQICGEKLISGELLGFKQIRPKKVSK